MNYLIDDVAKILGKPVPRRETLRLLGGALAAAVAAAVGIRPVVAAQHGCTKAQENAGGFSCGNGAANSTCCPPGTCCASHGNVANCCAKGSCVCGNGLCQSSTGGNCPSGCTRCVSDQGNHQDPGDHHEDHDDHHDHHDDHDDHDDHRDDHKDDQKDDKKKDDKKDQGRR